MTPVISMLSKYPRLRKAALGHVVMKKGFLGGRSWRVAEEEGTLAILRTFGLVSLKLGRSPDIWVGRWLRCVEFGLLCGHLAEEANPLVFIAVRLNFS